MLQDKHELIQLANMKMPFGKYEGRYLIHLPEAYRRDNMNANYISYSIVCLSSGVDINHLKVSNKAEITVGTWIQRDQVISKMT